MTIELVLSTHRDRFLRAILDQNWDALSTLYANEYMLVRSDGSVLDKDQVLTDLREQNVIFEHIEVIDEKVRLFESFAILTGEGRTTARQAGNLVASHFRFLAVYTQAAEGLRLLHFQSTAIGK